MCKQNFVQIQNKYTPLTPIVFYNASGKAKYFNQKSVFAHQIEAAQ